MERVSRMETDNFQNSLSVFAIKTEQHQHATLPVRHANTTSNQRIRRAEVNARNPERKMEQFGVTACEDIFRKLLRPT